jgi:hypothetical protein
MFSLHELKGLDYLLSVRTIFIFSECCQEPPGQIQRNAEKAHWGRLF